MCCKVECDNSFYSTSAGIVPFCRCSKLIPFILPGKEKKTGDLDVLEHKKIITRKYFYSACSNNYQLTNELKSQDFGNLFEF